MPHLARGHSARLLDMDDDEYAEVIAYARMRDEERRRENALAAMG